METRVLALEFRGEAKPLEGCSGVMQARMTGRHFADIAGSRAASAAEKDEIAFSSIVTVLPSGRFVEAGTISLGSAGTIRFDSPVGGCMAAAAEHGVSTGGVVWRILGGTGEFADATGFITSNFTV